MVRTLVDTIVDSHVMAYTHESKDFSSKRSIDNFPLSETAIRDNTSPALSLGFVTTKSNPDRIQKQTLIPLLKDKQSREATDHFSPILREMISEVEAERQNTITTRREYGATESDDQPETLVVEMEYSPRKIRILRAPGKKGGYIIANCRNSDWMLDLGVRLEREEKANKVRDERGGCESGEMGEGMERDEGGV